MKSLDQIIQKLKAPVPLKYVENSLHLKPMIQSYAGEDWKTLLQPDHKAPRTRILYQDQRFKLVLIYWKPFQKSKKHGHPPGGGVMKLLTGHLHETRFDPENPERELETRCYTASQVSYIHNEEAYHIVENAGPAPAVSLHLYALGASSQSYKPIVLSQNQKAA